VVYKTFDQWRELGSVVNKGEKSHKRRDDGKALFSDEQVKYLGNPGDNDSDYEDDIHLMSDYIQDIGDR
jgi:hypothetical protein